MKFAETPLAGAFVIDIQPRWDERGFFTRLVCVDEFDAVRINGKFVQQSASWNPRRGTLRGLHYQCEPAAEDKLVRVTRGAIFDVIVDIRRGSATFGQWFSIELTAENHRQLYIPQGFAHGFQTLVDETEVLYEMTVRFQPGAGRGIRWDDAALGIGWPLRKQAFVSERDQALPLLMDDR